MNKPAQFLLSTLARLQKDGLLSAPQLQKIRSAVKSGDQTQLKTYSALVQDCLDREDRLIRKFLANQERLLSTFNSLSAIVRENYVTAPRRTKIRLAEKQEQASAEDLLKSLD